MINLDDLARSLKSYYGYTNNCKYVHYYQPNGEEKVKYCVNSMQYLQYIKSEWEYYSIFKKVQNIPIYRYLIISLQRT